MPVIYIDVLFLTNFILDCMLLILTGKVSGRNYSPMRVIWGGLFGGFFGTFIFFLDFPAILSVVITVACAAVMVLTTYYPITKKTFLRLVGGFYLSSFLLGGALFGLCFFLGRPGIMSNGICYFPFSTSQLLICALPLAAFLGFSFKKIKNRLLSHDKYCTVMLSLAGRSATFDGFFDSGSSLSDPYCKKPVIIIDGFMAQKLYGDSPPPCRLIPYATIEATGFLKAFSPDFCLIICDDKHFSCECSIAISPAYSGGKAIINPDILLNWRKENDIQIFG